MLRILIAIVFLWGITAAGFSQTPATLNASLLNKILLEKLPAQGRAADDMDDMDTLCNELKGAGIQTTADFNTFIGTYKEKALSVEKDICRQVNEKNNLSPQVATGTYSVETNDLPEIKKGIFFTPAGLVRTMISLQQAKKK